MGKPSCFKTVSEVVAALHVRITNDKLKVVDKGNGGFSYIPWETTARELDRIFGPFGWSTKPISYSGDSVSGVYLAALELTVTAIDDETGIVVTKSIAGFGRGIAEASKADREKGGNVASKLQTHDTAASAAGSDALSKAAKHLGDAFGLFLYDKDDPASGQAKGGNQQRQPPNTLGARPNADETKILLGSGITADNLSRMPFTVWKKRLDEAVARNAPQTRQNEQQPVQPTTTPIPPVTPSESQQSVPQAPTPIDDKAWCEQWREKHNVPKNVMSGYCRCQGWQTSTQIRAVLEKSTDDTLIDIEQYQRSIAS